MSFVSEKAGVRGTAELTVTDADTSIVWHTGEVPVLSTPRLLALCEEATMAAMDGRLEQGQTSVGNRVELTHLAPVAVGSTVAALATLERAEGRRYTFSVSVTDSCGLVAAGRVSRVVVEMARFVEKAR